MIHPEVRMVEIIFPNQTNQHGTLFGGHALGFMDKAAYVAAVRYCRKKLVTVSSDKIVFKNPVRTGMLAEMIARIVKVGRTSIHVEVELWSEETLTGKRKLCTTGTFVLVALDDDGRPTPLNPPEGDRMDPEK